jgi:hypothetical protein
MSDPLARDNVEVTASKTGLESPELVKKNCELCACFLRVRREDLSWDNHKVLQGIEQLHMHEMNHSPPGSC